MIEIAAVLVIIIGLFIVFAALGYVAVIMGVLGGEDEG